MMNEDILDRLNATINRLNSLNLDDHGERAKQLLVDCAVEIRQLRDENNDQTRIIQHLAAHVPELRT